MSYDGAPLVPKSEAIERAKQLIKEMGWKNVTECQLVRIFAERDDGGEKLRYFPSAEGKTGRTKSYKFVDLGDELFARCVEYALEQDNLKQRATVSRDEVLMPDEGPLAGLTFKDLGG